MSLTVAALTVHSANYEGPRDIGRLEAFQTPLRDADSLDDDDGYHR